MATATPIAVGELVGTDWLNSVALAWWRDTTLVDIVSSITETDLIGVGGTGISIPANTLGTQRMLRINLLADVLNNTGGAQGGTFKVYYGGTAVSSQNFDNWTSSTNRLLIIGQFYVAAEGATNAQAVAAAVSPLLSNSGASPWEIPAANTTKAWTDLTIDSTVAQNLRLTFTPSTNSASLEFRKRLVIVEVV